MRHYYKDALDYAIIEIVDTKGSPLRYHELEEEINLHCNLCSATLSLHLRKLVDREVLYRREEKNGHTFYSLTKKFKDALDIQKKRNTTKFIEKTLDISTFWEKIP